MAQKGPFLKIGQQIKWSQIIQKNKFNPLQFFKPKILAQNGPLFYKNLPKNKTLPNQSKEQDQIQRQTQHDYINLLSNLFTQNKTSDVFITMHIFYFFLKSSQTPFSSFFIHRESQRVN